MAWIVFILIAVVTRLWNLGVLPAGFHIDEVKLGWNAYSMLKTGKDDWGHAFALHYDTFGDFRPTGYFYAAVPAIAALGKSEFATRLPGSMFGILFCFLLSIFISQYTKSRKIILYTLFLSSLSIWHISVSRASSEGIVALTLTLLSLILFRRSLVFSFLFAVISMFFYHSARVLTPLLLLITYLHTIKQFTVKHLVTLGLIGLTAMALIFNPQARGRLSQVSIFNDEEVRYELMKRPFEEGPNQVFRARLFNNKLIVYGQEFIAQYSQYFSGKFFLAAWEAKPARYNTVGYGVLTQVEFFYLIFGLIILAKGIQSKLPLWLMLAAVIPAAITTEDTPNLHRALFMVPFVIIITAYGAKWLEEKLPKSLKILVIFIPILNFIHFAESYIFLNRNREPIIKARNIYSKPLFDIVSSYSDQYTKILMTDIPDNLYPWFAFYGKDINATEFNAQVANRKTKNIVYGKWEFTTLLCPSEIVSQKKLTDVLAVDHHTCKDFPGTQIITKIPSDQAAFYILRKAI